VDVSTKPSIDGLTIQRLHTVTEAHVRGLAELLIDCVDGGASVSFMHPLAVAKALEFWRRVGERAALRETGLAALRHDPGVCAAAARRIL
jgi:hypothetical protein